MNVKQLYQDVTAQIIADIEAGTPTWLKPWSSESGALNGFLPYNCLTKKNYSGINVLLLWHTASRAGYTSNAWCGLKQMHAIGGKLKKLEDFEPPPGKPHATGQKATRIIKAKPVYKERDGELVQIALNVFEVRVFNIDQFYGYDEKKLAVINEDPPLSLDLANEAAAAFCDAQGVSTRHGGDMAAYSSMFDHIAMPDGFEDEENYFATLFHEHTHATGHPDRLARPLRNPRGSKAYAFEELIAELGSAFLCAYFGMEGTLQHAAYINMYLRLLKDDDQAIFRAASKAQEAMDYMLAKSGMFADERAVA